MQSTERSIELRVSPAPPPPLNRYSNVRRECRKGSNCFESWYQTDNIGRGGMAKHRTFLIVLSLALAAASSSCFVRRRAVVTPGRRRATPILAATKDELIRRLHAQSDPIQSFLMTADLSPSVLEPSKGTAVDYATVSAYILFLRPDDIRVLGRDPVLGSTIFDMVSSGGEFRVSIPPKKRFITGKNDTPPKPGNKLENLRPDALLNALMIYPPSPEADITVLENDPERGLYILQILRRNQDQFALARQVYFDGYTLQVSRQKMFDQGGAVLSDAKYSDWKPYGGGAYPSSIDIQRPKDNYEVQLSVEMMNINSPDVTAAKFILERPADFQVEELQ